MMRAKKQVVKEFYPEGHSPLWLDARVGDDCNHMCRANWEKQQSEIVRKHFEISKTLYPKPIDSSFEDHHKRLREQFAKVDPDSRYSDGSGGKRPEGVALCGHEFSKFLVIDWYNMERVLHPSIVTGFRENFTKRKQHGGDAQKEFRDDKTYTQHWNESLDGTINRFLDENPRYTIVRIEYSSGGWYGSGEGENNQASALVLFEVEER